MVKQFAYATKHRGWDGMGWDDMGWDHSDIRMVIAGSNRGGHGKEVGHCVGHGIAGRASATSHHWGAIDKAWRWHDTT